MEKLNFCSIFKIVAYTQNGGYWPHLTFPLSTLISNKPIQKNVNPRSSKTQKIGLRNFKSTP